MPTRAFARSRKSNGLGYLKGEGKGYMEWKNACEWLFYVFLERNDFKNIL